MPELACGAAGGKRPTAASIANEPTGSREGCNLVRNHQPSLPGVPPSPLPGWTCAPRCFPWFANPREKTPRVETQLPLVGAPNGSSCTAGVAGGKQQEQEPATTPDPGHSPRS